MVSVDGPNHQISQPNRAQKHHYHCNYRKILFSFQLSILLISLVPYLSMFIESQLGTIELDPLQ